MDSIPDLAPWNEISDDDEHNAATEAWFGDQTDEFYFKGIDCLKLHSL